MIADRQKLFPSRANNTMANYVLAARQFGGVFFILLCFFGAWSLLRLPLPPAVTSLIGYVVGLALFLPGVLLATRNRACGNALLGGGAACVFLTTANALFGVSGRSLPFHSYTSLCICLLLLVLFAALAWRAASPSASLLTAVLAVYGMSSVAPRLSPWENNVVVLAGVSVLAIWLCLWTTYRRDRFFTHAGLLAGYGAIVASGENVSIAVSVAGLLLFYIVLSVLAVDQVFRDETRHRSLLFFACLNTALCAISGYLLLYPDHTGWLRLITGGIFLASVVAGAALFFVHGGGALVSLYTATAILAFLACLFFSLVPGVQLTVPAAGCIVIALLSRWWRDRFQRWTEYVLLAITLLLSFTLPAQTGHVLIGPVGISAQWAWLLVAAGLLCVAARAHTCWIFVGRRPSDETRTVENIHYHPEQEYLAIVCAFAAALMTTIHTILIRGDSEMLPAVLAAQGMVFLGIGAMTFTPASALAGFVPVFAAHALFYAFPYLAASASWAPTDTPPEHLYGVIGATLALALTADGLLRTRLGGVTSLSEKIMAAIPYLPALVLFLLAAHGAVPPYGLPVLLGVITLPLLLFPRRGLPGITTLAFVLPTLSIITFLLAARSDIPGYSTPWYLPLLGAYVACLVLVERLFVRRLLAATWRSAVLSYSFVAFIALTGAVGIYKWNSGNLYFAALFGFAALLAFYGRFLGAKAYVRIAAALFVVGMLVWGNILL